MATRPQNGPPEIRNRKAFHDYQIGEKLEAGIALQGNEVKAIRAGKAQLRDAFVRIQKGEAYLYHAHIDEYAFDTSGQHLPRRPRKLLLHAREIRRLREAVQSGGRTIVPLRLYFRRGRVKVEIAVVTGKKQHDKREAMKRKTALREAEREVARYTKRGG